MHGLEAECYSPGTAVERIRRMMMEQELEIGFDMSVIRASGPFDSPRMMPERGGKTALSTMISECLWNLPGIGLHDIAALR